MRELTIIARRKARKSSDKLNANLIISLPKIWIDMKKINPGDVIDCYVDEKYRLVLAKEPIGGKDRG